MNISGDAKVYANGLAGNGDISADILTISSKDVTVFTAKTSPFSGTLVPNDGIELTTDAGEINNACIAAMCDYPPYNTAAGAYLSRTCSITYNGNGNSSGNVPAAETNLVYGELVTFADLGDLGKDGYQKELLSGTPYWNTAANGSGLIYLQGVLTRVTG